MDAGSKLPVLQFGDVVASVLNPGRLGHFVCLDDMEFNCKIRFWCTSFKDMEPFWAFEWVARKYIYPAEEARLIAATKGIADV